MTVRSLLSTKKCLLASLAVIVLSLSFPAIALAAYPVPTFSWKNPTTVGIAGYPDTTTPAGLYDLTCDHTADKEAIVTCTYKGTYPLPCFPVLVVQGSASTGTWKLSNLGGDPGCATSKSTTVTLGSAQNAPAKLQPKDSAATASAVSDSQNNPNQVDLNPLPHTATTNKFNDFLSYIFVVIGGLSLLMVVIGGFRYVLSQGDPQGVSKAKQTIIYALVGVLVSITAVSIVNFVLGKL